MVREKSGKNIKQGCKTEKQGILHQVRIILDYAFKSVSSVWTGKYFGSDNHTNFNVYFNAAVVL